MTDPWQRSLTPPLWTVSGVTSGCWQIS